MTSAIRLAISSFDNLVTDSVKCGGSRERGEVTRPKQMNKVGEERLQSESGKAFIRVVGVG